MAARSKISLTGVIKLVIIGDVHYDWDHQLDTAALKHLNPDAAIFVGDYGDEAVSVVQQIASVETPKAVMLGNHDAWGPLYLGGRDNKVHRQIEILGQDYIGYGTKQFKSADGDPFSVVGARPFSDGNSSIAPLTERMEKVSNMEDSAQKLTELLRATPESGPVILVGHNGPAGLGARRYDPCGKDFTSKPGDYGDKDMQLALQQIEEAGRPVALVTFGHMHQELYHVHGDGERNMIHIDPKTGTVFVNSAVVPRHGQHNGEKASHFVTATIEHGLVTSVDNVWVTNAEHPRVVRTEALVMSHKFQPNKLNWTYWNAYDQAWSKDVVIDIDEKLTFSSHEEL